MSEDIKPDINFIIKNEAEVGDDGAEVDHGGAEAEDDGAEADHVKVEADDRGAEAGADGDGTEAGNGAAEVNDGGPEVNDDAPHEEAHDGEDEEDEDEDDNIKVTIEEYDFKAIQKQSQPAKQPAPLVLQTNQEPIDINHLDEKPWRKPGANIEDYFNYGFDETTWKAYCDKQKHMKAIVDNINESQETFKIPVINAAPMVQPNSSPYMDVVAQPVAMHQHYQQHHQAGGRMKGVEEDVKKYEKRHRSSERRHSSKSRERRHDVKSREREREKDTERKRSRSRERRSKDTRSRQRSRSREDERRSKRHKSSRHA